MRRGEMLPDRRETALDQHTTYLAGANVLRRQAFRSPAWEKAAGGRLQNPRSRPLACYGLESNFDA